jgi:hypothetical protein
VISSLARLTATLAAIFVATACTVTDANQSPCRNVPAGGCPLSHGEACSDPACQAAYACNPDGTWSLDHVCPASEAGADASDGATSDADAGASLFDATVDAPPGAFGGSCAPPLQDTDCQLGTALSCNHAGTDPCCGCQDLYTCGTDGTWSLWGYCAADAGIVYAP